MDRRTFTHLCSSLLAGAASLSHQALSATEKTSTSGKSQWPITTLTLPDGKPLHYNTVTVGSSYVFAYPYQTTPCFLIRLTPGGEYGAAELTDKAGQTYQWQGGAGSDQALVAFSAICTHKMTHPAKPISHLNFRPEVKEYTDKQGQKQKKEQLITCCSEYSVYDPAQGARVLSGPATQPLAAIRLVVDESTQEIRATGSYGGDMYDEFLSKFGFRLAMENGVTDAKTLSKSSTVATPAAEYSRQRIRC